MVWRTGSEPQMRSPALAGECSTDPDSGLSHVSRSIRRMLVGGWDVS